MRPIISAEHLGKTYRSGKLEVPHSETSASISHQGEFVSIVGPSGSGKSTLFHVLGGLTQASSGTVTIDGTDLAPLSDAARTQLRRAKIGFVFQKFNLLPTLSAMGNIQIAHEISGRPEALDRGLLERLTKMLGMEGRLEHRPNELSGGESRGWRLPGH